MNDPRVQDGITAKLTRREALTFLGSGVLAGCASSSDAPPAQAQNDIHFASLSTVARLVESKEISPVELTRTMFERIDELDARLHSYVALLRDEAEAAARVAEKEIGEGNYRGSLHGVPIAVKDLCYTKGARTTGGMRVFGDFVPDFDATVVARLRSAGAVLLGKLGMTEGAMAGYHRDFEVPINPWGDELWAGASSSGSGVATAAGLCYGSLGSDTGGSIRLPAFANGVVGLKPTYGRVSRYGVFALADSLDHVGPMTRRTEDAARMFEIIAGADPNDPTSLDEPAPDMMSELNRGVDGLRIGVDRAYATAGVDAELVSAIDDALAHLESSGARVVEVVLPEWTDTLQAEIITLIAYEALAVHRATYPERADDYGVMYREFLSQAEDVTRAQYDHALELRAEYSSRLWEVLATVDAVLFPAGGVPFTVEHDDHYGGMAEFASLRTNLQERFLSPLNWAGVPSLSLRCGFNEAGRPLTMQLMGAKMSESLLCRIGHAYEETTSWHERHPAV